MSLLFNVLTFGQVNIYIIWILLVIEVCVNKNFANSIKTCRSDTKEYVTTQKEEENVKVSFCFTDIQTNNTQVLIQHNKEEFSSPNSEVQWQWQTNISYTYLHISIFKTNITDSDLNEWTLVLYNNQNNITHYEKSFKPYTDSPNQFLFQVDKKIDQNEPEITLFCSVSNFPKKIEIINRCGDILLHEKIFNPKNYKRTLDLTYYRPNSKVKNMIPSVLEAFECKTFDFQNESESKYKDVIKENEPVSICHLEDASIDANVDDIASIRLKVLAYPNITSVVVTKSTGPNIEDTSWTVETKNLSEVLWYLELTKTILQEEDFGNYTVSVSSNVNVPAKESFVLRLKDPPPMKEITTWDNCTNETSTVLYRIVKSGLPLTQPTNLIEPYTVQIVQNDMAREYLIKVFLTNFTQVLGKPKNFTVFAGSKKMLFSFKVSDNVYSLLTCVPTNPETTLWTRIGESVEFTMCLISDSLIQKENVGFNKNSMNNHSLSKYSIEIKPESNKYYVTWTLKNITTDDIKFYVFRIRDNLKQTATFILNLKLKEEIPYFCDNREPTIKVVSEKTLHIHSCIRAYPVLGRDVFVNSILYRINTTSNDVIVESSVDEKTFSNYITIKIPVKESLKTVNLTVKSVRNVTFSAILDVLENKESETTLTTLSRSTTTATSNTTSEHEDPWMTTPAQADPVNTSHTNILIFSVLAVVITVLLTIVLVYFVYFRRKLAKKKKSATPRLKYLNQPHYNNMEELKSLKVDKDQNLSNYETRYANIVKERNVDQCSRSTELAPGRFRNDEGLIYITIEHSDLQSRSSKSYTSKASQPETESNYVTIDPVKTKHFR